MMFENRIEQLFFSHAAEKTQYMMQKFKKPTASLCLPPLCIIKMGKSVKANITTGFAVTRPAPPVLRATLFLFHIQRRVDD